MSEEIKVQGAKHVEQEYHGDFPVSPEVVKSFLSKGNMMVPTGYALGTIDPKIAANIKTGEAILADTDPTPLVVNVPYKRVNPDAPEPKYNKLGDSGFDFVAMEDVIIAPGQTALIPIGLAFELPLSLEIQIRPRSGLSAKTKTRVTLGTDDANYRGELKVNVDNITQVTWTFNKVAGEVEPAKSDFVLTLENKIVSIYDLDRSTPGLIGKGDDGIEVLAGSIVIFKGQRIAQGVIVPVYKGIFTEKEELSESERGTTGFGGTGV